MLIVPAIIGLALFIAQLNGLSGRVRETKKMPPSQQSTFTTLVFREMDDGHNQIYALIIIVWCTLVVESWKRKQNAIANLWLMRDFRDKTLERA